MDSFFWELRSVFNKRMLNGNHGMACKNILWKILLAYSVSRTKFSCSFLWRFLYDALWAEQKYQNQNTCIPVDPCSMFELCGKLEGTIHCSKCPWYQQHFVKPWFVSSRFVNHVSWFAWPIFKLWNLKAFFFVPCFDVSLLGCYVFPVVILNLLACLTLRYVLSGLLHVYTNSKKRLYILLKVWLYFLCRLY